MPACRTHACACVRLQVGKAFDDAIGRYKAAVDGGRGAMLVAVCRGKVRTHELGVTVLLF